MSARCWLALGSFVVCMGLLAGFSTASGGDEKGSGKEKNGTNISQVSGKPSPAAQAVQRIHLAHELIDYGRRAKSPEALITAAEILAAVPPAEKKDYKPKETRPIGSGDSGTKDKAAKEKPAVSDDPAALLAEAKALAPEDRCVAELANKVGKALHEKPRGEIRGPRKVFGSLKPNWQDSWSFTFRAQELWVVSVRSTRGENLTLKVCDENDNVLGSDYGPAPKVSNTPKWTGPFTVFVINNTGTSVEYILTTN